MGAPYRESKENNKAQFQFEIYLPKIEKVFKNVEKNSEVNEEVRKMS